MAVDSDDVRDEWVKSWIELELSWCLKKFVTYFAYQEPACRLRMTRGIILVSQVKKQSRSEDKVDIVPLKYCQSGVN